MEPVAETGQSSQGDLYSSKWIRRNSRPHPAKAEAPAAKPTSKVRSTQQEPKRRSLGRILGTGFFVTADGVLVTAAHVIEDRESITVITPNGELRAQVVSRDPEADLALLRCDLETTATPPLPLSTHSSEVRFGESVFTVGFPNPKILGQEPKLSRGEITSLAGMKDHPRYWQTSVPVLYGNSGGPLVDAHGNVVGVISSKINALEGAETFGDVPVNITYGIKGLYLRPLLDRAGIEFQPGSTDFEVPPFVDVASRVRESVALIIAE